MVELQQINTLKAELCDNRRVLSQQAILEWELWDWSQLSALTSLIHWLLLLHHSAAEGHEAALVALLALNLCEGTCRSSGGVGVEKRLRGAWECELLLTAKKLYEVFWSVPSMKSSSRHRETRSNHYYRLWGGHRLHTSFIWRTAHSISTLFFRRHSFLSSRKFPKLLYLRLQKNVLFFIMWADLVPYSEKLGLC